MLFEMLDELVSLHGLRIIHRSDIVNRYLLDGCVAAHSFINAAYQEYNRDDIDLFVKVPGGRIELRRWYFRNKWNMEQTRDNLKPPSDNLLEGTFINVPSGTMRTYEQMAEQAELRKAARRIEKGGIMYEWVTDDLYVSGVYRLVRSPRGWRWESPRGNWKEYDEAGSMLR